MSFETPAEIVSYMIGRQVGDQLKTSQFPGFNLDNLYKGIQEALDNAEMPLSQEQIEGAYEVIQAELQKAKAAAEEKMKEDGAAFLEENAKKDGVVVTESGLQYEVLEEGEGASPEATDMVKVHYRGTLLDGTEFDSSYKRGEPAEFPLNRVISGWTEGVQLMKEGAKYRFHIPSELAYGARSTGAITPNSTLIFDVELLEVVKPEAEAPTE